jgi:cell division protein FtsB
MKKIENYQKKALNLVSRFGDIRFSGQLIFVVIILLISWSGVRAIQTNYGLQRQSSEIRQQNELANLQNNNIVLQNQYYNSNQYLELSARQNFGLAAPGEKELIVPDSVASIYVTNQPTASSATSKVAGQPGYQEHFQAWVDFFMHRNSYNN